MVHFFYISSKFGLFLLSKNVVHIYFMVLFVILFSKYIKKYLRGDICM
jgi:hypothetical protein